MTPLEALSKLLERAGANRDGAALVSEEELSRWPEEAVLGLKSKRLLMRTSPATTVVCPGCEQQCTMPVYVVPEDTSSNSFTICDKRDDINRVRIPSERLRQWRCGAEDVAVFVAGSLGLLSESQRRTDDRLWELGLVRGRKRSQMVCLRAKERLELVIAQNAVPLLQLVRFGANGYSVDIETVQQLVDAATTGDPHYTPSKARLEARKLKTQTMYENWRKKNRELKRNRPDLSDSARSRLLAKM